MSHSATLSMSRIMGCGQGRPMGSSYEVCHMQLGFPHITLFECNIHGSGPMCMAAAVLLTIELNVFPVSAAATPNHSCRCLLDLIMTERKNLGCRSLALCWLQIHCITPLIKKGLSAGDWRSAGCGPAVHGWPGPPARLAVAVHH